MFFRIFLVTHANRAEYTQILAINNHMISKFRDLHLEKLKHQIHSFVMILHTVV